MPGMDGYQFLQALRTAGGRASRIPMVFLTARGMTSDRIEVRAQRVDRVSATPAVGKTHVPLKVDDVEVLALECSAPFDPLSRPCKLQVFPRSFPF